MILLNQVSIKQENEQILKNITFSVKRNEFVFVYDNQNKSIKLLRELLTGRKNPDSGLIRLLNNKDISKDMDILKVEVGVVFKENILLPERSILDNFNFILEIKGLSESYYKSRVRKVLDLVNLKKSYKLRPDELLPHQQVRANIAQALLSYPSILVLEDPTSKLDEVNSQALLHLVERINDNGTTVVFLSTDKELVFRNKKRTICLEEGEIMGEKKKGFYA